MVETNELHTQQCSACRKGAPTLTEAEISALQPHVPEWNVITRDNIKTSGASVQL